MELKFPSLWKCQYMIQPLDLCRFYGTRSSVSARTCDTFRHSQTKVEFLFYQCAGLHTLHLIFILPHLQMWGTTLWVTTKNNLLLNGNVNQN